MEGKTAGEGAEGVHCNDKVFMVAEDVFKGVDGRGGRGDDDAAVAPAVAARRAANKKGKGGGMRLKKYTKPLTKP